MRKETINGFYFEPGRSTKQPAYIAINELGAVEVVASDQDRTDLDSAPMLAQMKISARLGNTPRYLQFEQGGKFETLENDFVDQQLKTHSSSAFGQWLHKLENRLSLIVTAAIFSVAVVIGFIQYGVPALATTVAEVLPQQASDHLGDGTLTLLDEAFFKPSALSPQRQEKLTTLFQQYTDPDADYPVNILFRSGGKRLGANAMALPDGTVIFTDELVALAEDDRELVAIFGHEIGHLAYKHSLRRVVQDSLLALVWVLISGDASSAASLAVAMPALLLELAYSREFEREADDFAYQFMVRHQLEPHYFASIMSRLDAQLNASASKTSSTEDKSSNTEDERDKAFDSKFSSYLSTHPANKQRIKRFLNSPVSN